ncbi:MAG: hypothetical protein ACLTYW_10140 [Collinsella sp.]
MSAAERKELLQSSEIVYLYHNKIDATGRNSPPKATCSMRAPRAWTSWSRSPSACTDVPGARDDYVRSRLLFTANELPECLFLGKNTARRPGAVWQTPAVVAQGDALADIANGALLYLAMNMDHVARVAATLVWPRAGSCTTNGPAAPSATCMAAELAGARGAGGRYRRLSASSKFVDTQTAKLRVLSEPPRYQLAVWHCCCRRRPLRARCCRAV